MQQDSLTNANQSIHSLGISGISPTLLRELSGIFPTFTSAFKELISNSYDAEATNVIITISNDATEISIEDDGTGITPYEFHNDYIRLGSSRHASKNSHPLTTRKPIGKKGIGYLAVARYCRSVEIVSAPNRVLRVNINRTINTNSPKSRNIKTNLPEILKVGVSEQDVKIIKLKINGTRIPKSSCEVNHGSITIHLDRKMSKHLSLDAELSIDYRDTLMRARIDYEHLLNLPNDVDLNSLEDFYSLSIESFPEDDYQRFTQITLHLKDFVTKELLMGQRRGNVKNVISWSGIKRFVWEISRNTPIQYDASILESSLIRKHIPSNNGFDSTFKIQVNRDGAALKEIRRPIYGSLDKSTLENDLILIEPLRLDEGGIKLHGFLMGFKSTVYPAELRGISVRVRGVQVGPSSFFGADKTLPLKYKSLLSHVVGEVIISDGVDAINGILPGRSGLYDENANVTLIINYLTGRGLALSGALGQFMEKFYLHLAVEQSARDLIFQAAHKREILLEVTRAVTIHSMYEDFSKSILNAFGKNTPVENTLSKRPIISKDFPNVCRNYEIIEVDNLIDYDVDYIDQVININSDKLKWNSQINILGHVFSVVLCKGQLTDPIVEFDMKNKVIYLNWKHATRGRMGDREFLRTALYWKIAYLCSENDINRMMDLALSFLSYSD